MKQASNLEAEEAVLGAMLASNRAVLAAQDNGLQPEHFYRPGHGQICKAVYELDARGDKADPITVGNVLREWGELEKAGGMPALNTLLSTVPSVSNAGHHAQIVIDVAMERGIQRAATQLSELVEGPGSAPEKLAEAERIVADIALDQAGDFETIGAQTSEAFEQIKRAYEGDEELVGMKTGFTRLDKVTSGFQPGQLIILAARPAQGKSLLAQNIAENVAGGGQKVAIFSLEMDAAEIGKRMLSSLSGVQHDKIKSGRMTPAEWSKITEAKAKLDALTVYTVEGGVTATELRARSRRLQRSLGLDLLIVDYLQLLSGSGRENRTEEVSEISRGLKLLARELGIPVLCLSQLNRGVEARQNKRPQLSDLRESGAIEQDADKVLFIYRDEYYDENSANLGEAEIIVSKQRDGATGTVKLAFRGERCKFSNLASSGDREAAISEATNDDIPY